MEFSKQVDVLNDLLSKCYDAEKGYEEAADQVHNVHLKETLELLSRTRYDFGHQIKAEIKALGGDIEKGDTIAAKAHRVWMDLRTAFSTNNDGTVLDEVIRGENNALEHYETALKELDGYEAAYTTIAKQRDSIATTLGTIKMMEIAQTA